MHLRARLRGPGPAALLLGLSLLGCRSGGGSDTSDDGSDTTGDTTDAGIEEPAFLNPAVGEFDVDSVRHVPLDIVVRAITPGNTQLILDGQSVGDLGPGDLFGELTRDRLRLFLRGALVIGTHTLQLVSSGPDGPLFSTELTMVIQAPDVLVPRFSAVLVPDPLAPGHALATGPGRALAVLTTGKDPVLRAFLPDGDTWSKTPAAELPLDGHVLEADAFGPTFAVQATPAGLRVAHRRGLPGDAIVTRDLALAPDPVLGEAQVALDLNAAIFADHEYAFLGAPALVGDALLAEFTAAADSELAHPGDRGVAHLRWRDGAWSDAQRVATAQPTDLDGLGPYLLLSDLDQTRRPALAVRVGRRHPGVLSLAAAGGAQVTVGPDSLVLPGGDPGLLTILAGDLDAHAALAVTPGALALALYGTSGEPRSNLRVPTYKHLPDVPLTAPPAHGVVLGYSTFLVPFGDAAPVHVVFSDGNKIFFDPLDDPAPVHCSALALFPGLGGDDGDPPALTFACLHRGVLRHGVLTAAQAQP